MQELEKILREIEAEFDRRIDIQLKIMAGLGDDVYRYGYGKSLDAYKQGKLFVTDIIRKHMNDGWIPGESESRPQNKQLCVVIHKTGMKYPQIYQWRIAENNFSDTDMFVSYGLRNLEIEDVKYWKPLMIPRDMEEQILSEIEKCF